MDKRTNLRPHPYFAPGPADLTPEVGTSEAPVAHRRAYNPSELLPAARQSSSTSSRRLPQRGFPPSNPSMGNPWQPTYAQWPDGRELANAPSEPAGPGTELLAAAPARAPAGMAANAWLDFQGRQSASAVSPARIGYSPNTLSEEMIDPASLGRLNDLAFSDEQGHQMCLTLLVAIQNKQLEPPKSKPSGGPLQFGYVEQLPGGGQNITGVTAQPQLDGKMKLLHALFRDAQGNRQSLSLEPKAEVEQGSRAPTGATVEQQAQPTRPLADHIREQFPRTQGESNTAWARRIHENSPIVWSLSKHERIALLSTITEATPRDLRQEPTLRDTPVKLARQAQEVKNRWPRNPGESAMSWAQGIYENDPSVQSLPYRQLIKLLSLITDASESHLRTITAMRPTPVE